ncbi:MAG: DUF4433 domain-containing protein [Rhodospirillales bacterium]|nr:DUF4433 domain-containing protein [Rhodospirillales bacterium]
MSAEMPRRPKIYHIVHLDRLKSIIADGFLWCDSEAAKRRSPGTVIGLPDLKQARRSRSLASHPGLSVGDCAAFYFCPRSIMLYILWRCNHQELTYRGGQEPIVHLQADLYDSVAWADSNNRRWAFTLSNASSGYFEDRSDLGQLHEINWAAVRANQWSGPKIDLKTKEGKQAEFLVERCFPWCLVERIGVRSQRCHQLVIQALATASHKPETIIVPRWYYPEWERRE